MTRHVAIIGAAGAVGSMVASQMLQAGVLDSGDQLTLIGRGSEESSGRRAALREDLLDAFSDRGVAIACSDRVDLPGVAAFVMCAGATLSEEAPARRDLARINAPVFEEAARLVALGSPDAFVIVVSNPVELAVAIFARHLGRERVVGMGAQQDSLRFARAVADHLGVARAEVEASVLGQHGEAMVPLWSGIRLAGDRPALRERLDALRSRYARPQEREPAAALLHEAEAVADRSGLAAAYDALDAGSPVTRILVEPVVTTLREHSTPNSTAHATLRVLRAALDRDGAPLCGQVLLAGEFVGLHGVCGAPIGIGAGGWTVTAGVEPDAAERRQLADAAAAIAAETRAFLDPPS